MLGNSAKQVWLRIKVVMKRFWTTNKKKKEKKEKENNTRKKEKEGWERGEKGIRSRVQIAGMVPSVAEEIKLVLKSNNFGKKSIGRDVPFCSRSIERPLKQNNKN